MGSFVLLSTGDIEVHPEFAKKVDPILLTTMRYVEQIEHADKLVAGDVRATVVREIDHAEDALGHTDEWRLAKYALCALIDAQFISAQWNGKGWWKDNPLEKKYFGDRVAHDYFFEQATKAGALPRKDALEVYYLCVILGFRGFYGDQDTGYRNKWIERLGLPYSIEGWCAQTARSLQLKQGRPDIKDVVQVSQGIERLRGRENLVIAIILLTLILSVAAAVLWPWMRSSRPIDLTTTSQLRSCVFGLHPFPICK